MQKTLLNNGTRISLPDGAARRPIGSHCHIRIAVGPRTTHPLTDSRPRARVVPMARAPQLAPPPRPKAEPYSASAPELSATSGSKGLGEHTHSDRLAGFADDPNRSPTELRVVLPSCLGQHHASLGDAARSEGMPGVLPGYERDDTESDRRDHHEHDDEE
jgi:hypothetical protein